MNTRLLAELIRARIVEAHKLARLRREMPPCVPQINAERRAIAEIDTKLDHETGGRHGDR